MTPTGDRSIEAMCAESAMDDRAIAAALDRCPPRRGAAPLQAAGEAGR